MRAYEVSLNGKRLYVAGIGGDGHICVYVTYRSDRAKDSPLAGADLLTRYLPLCRVSMQSGFKLKMRWL